jgi:hypothetical protein
MTNEEQVYYSSLTNVTPAFEGAATNYQTGLRGLFNSEADALVVRELRYLQSRSNHIINNNGYGAIALKNWVTNASSIGTVWKYANGRNKGKKHPIMQDYWDSFAENPWYDGFGNLQTGQGISNSSIFITGSSHIRKLIIRESGKSVPLKLQLIPTKYFYKKGILESKGVLDNFNVISVPADEIIHTFIRKEPGQWLGIPLLASVLLTLYKIDDLTTATVNKQIVAQHIAILIKQTKATLSMLPVGTPTEVTTAENKPKTIFKNNVEEGQVLYLNNGRRCSKVQT